RKPRRRRTLDRQPTAHPARTAGRVHRSPTARTALVDPGQRTAGLVACPVGSQRAAPAPDPRGGARRPPRGRRAVGSAGRGEAAGVAEAAGLAETAGLAEAAV